MKINTSYVLYIYVADPSTDPPTPVTGLGFGDFGKLVVVNFAYDASPSLAVSEVDAVNVPGVYIWVYLTTATTGSCRIEISYDPLDLKFVGEYPVTTYDIDDFEDVAKIAGTKGTDNIYDIVNVLPSSGSGGISVDHNTGGTDNMRVLRSGVPLDNVEIWAYLKADYDAGNRSITYRKGWAMTNVEGRWRKPMFLDADTYTFTFFIQGESQTATKEAVVS